MPVLKNKDLVAIKNQYLKYKQLSNKELNQLFDDMKMLNSDQEDDFSYKDLIKDYAICSALTDSNIYISPSDLHNILENKYGVTDEQINFVIENIDDLDSYPTITHYGEVANIHDDVENDQQKPKKIDNKKGSSFFDDDDDEIEQETIEEDVNFNINDRLDRNTIFRDAMENSAQKEEDQVFFNFYFFNCILDEKESLKKQIDSEYEPTSSLGLGKDLLEDIENDKEQDADFRSDGKIKAYIVLNERSKRSFLEKLKHPIQSIYEWYAKNKISKELKEEFGLKEETLNTISDKIMQKKHAVENGKKIFDKKFICFDKDGRMITTETSIEECKKAAKAMFPSAKENNHSLNNIASDTSMDNRNSNKSEKYISNERQMNKEIGKD